MKLQYNLPEFPCNKPRELAIAARNREVRKLYLMGIANKSTLERIIK